MYRICALQNNHDLAEIFEGVRVDLEGIILLEQEGKDNLINFANAGLGEINYEAYLSEVTRICIQYAHTDTQVQNMYIKYEYDEILVWQYCILWTMIMSTTEICNERRA